MSLFLVFIRSSAQSVGDTADIGNVVGYGSIPTAVT